MYHLAQVNVARMRAPLSDPLMAEFVAQLDPINALADHSPGFIWRLQSEEGDATAIRPFDDNAILVNLSVWASLPALADYVYTSAHRQVLQQRRQWFERFEGVYTTLWWVLEGHIPSVTEAKARLEHLQAHGPSAFAFTFKQPFPVPEGTQVTPDPVLDECPA